MGGELAARMGDEIGGHSGGLGWIGMAIGGLIGAVIGYIVLAAAIAAIAAATVLTGGLVLGLVIAAFFAVGTTAGLMAVGAKIGKRHSSSHLGGGKCGKITSGAERTFIEGQRAARAEDDKTDHGDNKIAQGSKTVYVEGKPLSREGDKIKCGGKIIHGCEYTRVGGEPTEAEEIEDESQPSEHFINVLEKISAVGLYGAAALELGGAIVGAYVGAAAEGAVGSVLWKAGAKIAVKAIWKKVVPIVAWDLGGRVLNKGFAHGYTGPVVFYIPGSAVPMVFNVNIGPHPELGEWFDAACQIAGGYMGAKEAMEGELGEGAGEEEAKEEEGEIKKEEAEAEGKEEPKEPPPPEPAPTTCATCDAQAPAPADPAATAREAIESGAVFDRPLKGVSQEEMDLAGRPGGAQAKVRARKIVAKRFLKQKGGMTVQEAQTQMHGMDLSEPVTVTNATPDAPAALHYTAKPVPGVGGGGPQSIPATSTAPTSPAGGGGN